MAYKTYLDEDEVQVINRQAGKTLIQFPHGATLLVATSLLSPTPSHVRHRAADRPTAVQAAMQVDMPGTRSPLGPMQIKVLAALVAAGGRGLIDHEHEPINNISQDTAGKRRGEMMDTARFDPPLVEDSGLTRKTPRGRDAAVWRITQAGYEVYRSIQARGAA